MIGARTRIVVLAGVLGAASALGLVAPTTTATATAQSLPITYDLGVVLPGESHSMERPVEIDRTVSVVSADFGSRATGGAWAAELCSERCIAIDDLHDTILDAGDYRLVVTLTMPDDESLPDDEASAGDAIAPLTASAEGALVLLDVGVDASATLPDTGGTLPIAATILGGALASGGALLLIVAGRRRSPAAEVSA